MFYYEDMMQVLKIKYVCQCLQTIFLIILYHMKPSDLDHSEMQDNTWSEK